MLGVRYKSVNFGAGKSLAVTSLHLTTEPDDADPTYVGILVMVLSAAAANPHVLSLVPSHSLRHWRVLRERLPAVIPAIQVCAVGSLVLELAPLQHGPASDLPRANGSNGAGHRGVGAISEAHDAPATARSEADRQEGGARRLRGSSRLFSYFGLRLRVARL
ncbi:hypothetical protein T484DRAFT_1772940 [Baffinella frigidus]|nr:hypothetical protein T484DRAFT_1772940 [Cryptophyta sp. CCMP2293]